MKDSDYFFHFPLQSHSHVHLDPLTLRCIGLDATDETIYFYVVIEKRSRKIQASYQSVVKQALKAYHELLHERKQRKTSKPGSRLACLTNLHAYMWRRVAFFRIRKDYHIRRCFN